MFQRNDSGFVEQMVRRERTVLQTIAMIATYFFGGLISLLVAAVGLTGILRPLIGDLFAYLFQMLSLLLMVGGLVLTYRLGTSFYKEYEYIFTAGELDIDCIVARSKRSRLLTVKVASADKGGIYRPERMEREHFDAKIFAYCDANDPDNRYLVVNDSKKGRVLLVFSPDEKLLKNMRPYLPRHFSQEFCD